MSDEYQPRTAERIVEILRAQDPNPRSWQAEAADKIETLRGALTVVKVYINHNPLADAVVVPKGATLHPGSDLSGYPTIRQIVDDALAASSEAR